MCNPKRYAQMFLMAFLLVMFSAGCGKSSGGGGGGGGGSSDTTAPTVGTISPVSGATGVPLNARTSATFSEAMDAATITTSTFTLACPVGTAIAGAVTYNATTNVATFTPTSNLPASTVCTATITTGVKDVAGNALAANRVWTFTTGTSSDTTAPTVSSTIPANGATGVSLNQNLSATFSEAMDPLTITTSTFTLVATTGSVSVAGTVSYSGVTAVFDPTSNLTASTNYTATITTGAKDLAGNALAANRVWTFTTGTSSDTTAPTVSSTIPANGATGVSLNQNLSATFSEAMDPLTITTSTFTLVATTGSVSVAGTVSYSGFTTTFDPTSNLTASTNYTATITTGAKDLAGNALAANRVWTFTTGTSSDTTAPTVSSTVPADAATGVSLNQNLSAAFSEAMDPLTITTSTFTLACPSGTPVTGAVSYTNVGTTATFDPDSNLPANTVCTATILSGSSGVKDLAGNALASNKVWTFTTGAAPDTTAPTVSSSNPADGAVGVCLNHTVNATFSEAMDPLTITDVTFTVAGVTGTVDYNATSFVATFTPGSNLTANTSYTATLTTGVKDLAGNALAANRVWTFTTGTTTCTTAPVLNSAQNFAVIAAAGITNAAFATAITGDMGLSPNGTTSITGFPPGTVDGTTYTGNSTSIAGLARADAGTAYQAAKTSAALPGFVTVAGNIGGTTRFPGTYHSTSTISIEATPLTLDAQGDANAVWIFDMESTLTTTPGGTVILAGGAQAKNVFWRVGSSATLGAAIFKGTILADTSITLGTTAIDVAGRLLAGSVTTSGAVAFNDAAHTVVRPAP